VVGYFGEKPEQILIETENTLAHLAQYFNPKLDSRIRESNLHKAYSHLVRVTLDCYKLLWWKINEDLLIVYNDKDINIFYINAPINKFNYEYQLFVSKSQEARKKELECIGVDPLESVELYKETILIGKKLFGYIDRYKKQQFDDLKTIIDTRKFVSSLAISFVVGVLTGFVGNYLYGLYLTK